MSDTGVQVTRVVLSDYPYLKDIENRLSLSSLTAFEVEVLHEILHHSLKFPIDQLAETLEVPTATLLPILSKLSSTRLFKVERDTLIVDKEMRKYYEFQIERFDDDFQPTLEFLQSLLSKVPIHVLPNWYAISRTTDNIFASIIEKYLSTPKIYRHYLAELKFDDPMVKKIIQDLYQAPQFKVSAADLIQKHKLSREKFEEYILLLEYHFVCCLRYEQKGSQWEEVVTPFQEWLDYLLFESQSRSRPIQDIDQITRTCKEEFWLLKDLMTLINSCPHKGIKVSELKKSAFCAPNQLPQTLRIAQELEFIRQGSGSAIIASENGLLWLKKSLTNQAHDLLSDLSFPKGALWTTKNVRLVEKSLRLLPANEWIYLDDFMSGFSAAVGDREPIVLKNRGKKWKYTIPSYAQNEIDFVKEVITQRLFQLGIVSTGMHQGKVCFCLTQYGYHFIH